MHLPVALPNSKAGRYGFDFRPGVLLYWPVEVVLCPGSVFQQTVPGMFGWTELLKPDVAHWKKQNHEHARSFICKLLINQISLFLAIYRFTCCRWTDVLSCERPSASPEFNGHFDYLTNASIQLYYYILVTRECNNHPQGNLFITVGLLYIYEKVGSSFMRYLNSSRHFNISIMQKISQTYVCWPSNGELDSWYPSTAKCSRQGNLKPAPANAKHLTCTQWGCNFASLLYHKP